MKALPLNPIGVQAPFQQWGLDFIGKFKDNSSNGYSWILTTTDYFTKWVEAIPTKKATDAIVMDFLEDKIITRFGVPARIITDNGPCFVSFEMSYFCFKYGVGAGSRSYRKSCYIGIGKSKKTVPERLRRESSPTALKVVVEKRELNHYT